MAVFHCIFCDGYFDTDTQSHADYDGIAPKCEDCVDKDGDPTDRVMIMSEKIDKSLSTAKLISNREWL